MAIVFDPECERLLQEMLDDFIKVQTRSKKEWKKDVVMRKARENKIEVALRCKRDLYQN